MKFITVKDLDTVENIVSNLRRNNLVYALDLETTSTDPFRGQIVGAGLSWSTDGAVYIPIRHRHDQPFSTEKAVELLRPLLTDYQFVAFNAVFELEFLEHDFKVFSNIQPIDASLLTYVEGKFDFQSLKIVSKEYCPQIKVQSFADFMVDCNLNPNKNTIDEAPIGKVGVYCGRDTLAAYIIYRKVYERVKNHPIYKLETKVFPVTKKIRANGVRYNKEWCVAETERLNEELLNLQKIIEGQVSDRAGEPIEFNIGSNVQLGEVLYNILKLPCTRYTEKGQPKTDKDTLANLKWEHPIVRNIISYKEIKKRITTYYAKYSKFVQEDGRIHASYNQTGVVTGRFSCSDPNLQNVPGKQTWTIEAKDSEYEIQANPKVAICASSDAYLIEFDYSQIEARIAAGYTQEPVLLNAFSEGVDFHTKTASLSFNVPVASVSKEQRFMGKRLNFALAYGMGKDKLYFTLRKDVNISQAQSDEFHEKYTRGYAKMFHEAAATSDAASRTHFVETIFGRRVPVNMFKEAEAVRIRMNNAENFVQRQELNKKWRGLISEAKRMAYNGVIQGSAADLLKIALVKVQDLIDDKYKDKAKIVLTTHDSLTCEVQKHFVSLDDFIADVLMAMVVTRQGYPVFMAEYEVGQNWGELQEAAKDENVADFVKRFQEEKHAELREEGVRQAQEENYNTFVLEIEKGDARSPQQVETLNKFLAENSGTNTIILKMGDMEKELPYKVSLGVEDREKILFIFGGKFYERL